MSHIYNEKMKSESQFSCTSNPAEERNTDSSGNYRRQEVNYDEFMAHGLRKISTQFTDVQSLASSTKYPSPSRILNMNQIQLRNNTYPTTLLLKQPGKTPTMVHYQACVIILEI